MYYDHNNYDKQNGIFSGYPANKKRETRMQDVSLSIGSQVVLL